MINNNELLRPFVAGDRVLYVPNHAYGDICHRDCERGTVSSISKSGETVFVKFDTAVSRIGWDGATAQGCYPDSLQLEK